MLISRLRYTGYTGIPHGQNHRVCLKIWYPKVIRKKSMAESSFLLFCGFRRFYIIGNPWKSMFRLLQRLGYTQILRLSNGFGFTMNPRLTPATAASSCIPADAWQINPVMMG